MSFVALLLILAFICFLVEAFRGNFVRNPPPQPPPRYYIGWGWIGLALVVASWLIGPGRHVLS